MDAPSRKSEIRAAALSRREALDPQFRRQASAAIMRRILATEEFRRASTVMAYASFGSEVDTSALLTATLDAGKRLLLPKVNRTSGLLDVYGVTNLEHDLRPGTWGIREPLPEACSLCDTGEIDFILVPGAAFDRTGGRIGYGRGYYDRLLASCEQPATVAAAFEVQIVDAIPMEPHDARVEVLVTEVGQWRSIDLR